jgi:hypothetical protein
MADFGIKSTEAGKDVTSTSVGDFTSDSRYNTLKIRSSGHGTATLIEDPPASGMWSWTTTINHGLGYNPLFFAYIGVLPFYAQGMGLELIDDWTSAGSTATWYAQSFTAEKSSDILNVTVTAAAYPAPSTGSAIDFYIFSDTGGVPNASIGTVGTQTLPADALSEYISSVLTPASAITLTQGTKYWLVAKNSYKSATVKGHIPFATASAYAGGKLMRTTNSGTNWSDFNGDMAFRIMFDYPQEETTRRWYQTPGIINSSTDDVGAFNYVNIGSGYTYPDANNIDFQIDGLDIDENFKEVEYKYFICVDPNKEAWNG